MRSIRYTSLLVALGLCLGLRAQTPAPIHAQQDRVQTTINPASRVSLSGHIPQWASAANDDGAVTPATRLRLTFVLTRSSERQAAFEKLLADQQNPASSSYHQWLTPQQVGSLYGPTQHDLDALTVWLSSQGFSITELAPSGVFLTVEAPAATITTTLATPLHNFRLNGESRLSTTAEPSLPAAVAPLVASITGLSATPILPQSHSQVVKLPSASSSAGAPLTPQFTLTSGAHFLTPGDFATIFDITPVYNAGFTGTGQKVAIIGRSRVTSTDVTEYEANVGLSTNLPNTIVPPNGIDPGLSPVDEGEALLDVDRVIGTAPNVQADLVISASAGGYDGIYVAAQYEVQTLRDPVMNISFGSCEVYAGASGVTLWDTLFAQAASEGISVFISSGDSGAGFCNTQFATPFAYQFRSVNYICSSSYATCLGATELVDTANPTQYWSTTNTTSRSSALSYIPEGAWNDPTSTSNSGVITYLAQGTGGGASIYITKPAWQTGVGVPADGARDLPDLSFPGSGHDGYYMCYAAVGGNCAAGYFEYSYGTSAAAPGLAGITALLNQKAGGSQGNLNPLLYRLASTAGVFHDATPASSGISTCDVNTPSLCNNSDPSPTSLTGGLAGFALTTGYDQSTGNGSLDVYNFITAATASVSTGKAATTLAITGSATSIVNPGSATFTATLASGTAGTPTGTVQFYVDTVATGAPVTLSSNKAMASISFTNAGSQLISAIYSGDTTYASATAPGIALQVVGLASQTSLTTSATSATTTTPVTFTATVKPATGTGTPSGLVRFYDSYSGYFAVAPLVNGIATAPAHTFIGVTTHFIYAYYLGDTVFQISNSGGTGTSITLTITQGTPVITWPVPAPITYGTALSATQLDATSVVTGPFAYTPAIGTVLNAGTQTLSVTFAPADTTDYKTASSSVSLTVNQAPLTVTAANASRVYGAANPAFTGTITGVVNADPITATYASTATAVTTAGTYPIVASLVDPSNRLLNYTVTNNPGTLTITKAGTVTTATVPASTTAGASVTLSATVVSTTTGIPTGSVTFSIGTTSLGTATLNASGAAALVLTTLPIGSDSILATYNSDTNFSTSVSAPAIITVAGPDFTLAASPASGSVNAGQAATFAVTVTPVNGFIQPVAFSISGLPSNTSASFTPTTLTPAGSPISTMLTITTDVHAAVRPLARPGISKAPAITLCLAVLLLPFARGRKLSGLRITGITSILGALTICMFLSLTGCGGSATSSTPKTPDGSYTFTITATSGATSHTTTVSLTVAN